MSCRSKVCCGLVLYPKEQLTDLGGLGQLTDLGGLGQLTALPDEGSMKSAQ